MSSTRALLSSSPPPVGHKHESSTLSSSPIHTNAVGEPVGDTIPCSPAAFLRGRSREPVMTQPTQILPVPGLGPERSSSPASVIEVPASSPFQPRQPGRLGSALAPRGTVYRPPPKPSVAAVAAASPTLKRPAAEPIILSDDDDDDDVEPPRGDIRPTTFQARLAEFAYGPAHEELEMRRKLRQIFDVFGNRYSHALAREALKVNELDVDDAIIWLESRPPPSKQKQSRSQGSLPPPRPVPKVSSQTQSRSSEVLDRDSSHTVTSSPPRMEEVPKKQPKRRLVQGLKKRPDSSPPKPVSLPPSSSRDPSIISLGDTDQEDVYRAETSPAPIEAGDEKVLDCINTSTLKELGAMTGIKETLLEPMIEDRPFRDLRQARRVSAVRKPGSRKSVRNSIGESVVDAVGVFLRAVTAIDEVVSKCEAKGQAVRSVMDLWDIDMFGHDKRSNRTSPEGDMPLTPASLGFSFTRPLVSQQPMLMDGHCQMKSFQVFGLNWMSLLYNYEMGCILADEMGLGKTCQVISFMCYLVEEQERRPESARPWPNLIVVPPSTYNNWLQEFERFAPGLSVVGYRGSQAERADIAYGIRQEPEAVHVVLATYSQITTDEDIHAMVSFDLNAAIFDEGHKMKNPGAKIYKDLQRIPASWKMLLTGTPVQNNLMEMTSLLSFINPKMFEGYMEDIRYIFSQKVTIRDVSNGAFLYAERVTRARTILEPFILQRRKSQVLSDMPQKICTQVYCEMTDSQKETYTEYQELFRLDPSLRHQASKAPGRQNDQNNVWMQLRKAALHPLLFRRHFTDDKVKEMGKILMETLPQSELHQPDLKHLVQELKNSSDFELHLWCRDYASLLSRFDIPAAAVLDSGKVKKLLELIDQYSQKGDRVLVFSKFSRLIELLQEVLAQQGIDHRVLTGTTNVAERQGLIDEFNDNVDIPVFLLTTGAGGTGINLTSANKVIIFDQSDNPQDDIQAENRAHRLGQKRNVEVVRLIASQTIEELIYEACQKKIELANKVTGVALEESQKDTDSNLEQEVRKMMLQGHRTPP